MLPLAPLLRSVSGRNLAASKRTNGARAKVMSELHPILAPGFKARPWRWQAAEPPNRDIALPDRAAVASVGGGYAGLSAALTLRRLA